MKLTSIPLEFLFKSSLTLGKTDTATEVVKVLLVAAEFASTLGGMDTDGGVRFRILINFFT